eukprot:m.373590 g.373590  ORF g.373590 m.373590 type:complete len:132 (-) comp19998_c2_seq18:712-1107(-)
MPLSLFECEPPLLGARARAPVLTFCLKYLLFLASRVKASNTSKHMQPLEQTSRQVSDATKALIAAAREAGKQSQTPISAQDYLKMSLPQARRLEMELQVRVIELEATLSRERERLGQVRRANYHKSGDSQA